MRIVKLDSQEEWLEFRADKITGTKNKDLIPKVNLTKKQITDYLDSIQQIYDKKAKLEELYAELTPVQVAQLKSEQAKKDEFYKLVAAQVARPITPNDYVDRLNGQAFSMMARGHLLEPEAVEALMEKTGINFKHSDNEAWVSDHNPRVMCSPDAYEEGEIIRVAAEIKSPDTHKIIRAYDEDEYPQEYHEQVVEYFICNENLETLYFTLYTDVMPSLPLLVFTINREDVEDDIELIKEYQNITLKEVDALVKDLAFI